MVLTLIVDHNRSKSNEEQLQVAAPEIESVDTFIPSGFVLVPIEIQNLASLDSMIGQFGVVSLYNIGSDVAIASHLKLIRSPKDPSQFAVLVPKQIAKKIVKLSDKPFFVSVLNPTSANERHTEAETTNRIEWENSL